MLKKILKIVLKVIGGLFGGAVGLIFLAWIGLSVGKYFIYHDYYKIWNKEAKNPGLNDGFIPQGCTYNEDDDYYVTAGYMKDGSVSRIYKVDKKNKKITTYNMTSEGKEFLGHTGGIQYAKGYLYLANEGDGIYKFPASSLKDSGSVEIGKAIKVNNHSSFVFSDNDFLYVGEFNDSNKYACDNEFNFKGKTNYAFVTKYSLDNLKKPLAIYSIGNQIQGFAITDEGSIVLSRSWGVSSSDFYIFEASAIEDTDTSVDGARVYFLDTEKATRILKAPAMSEDLDYKDGKVIYLSESACNKYIFGKFFFDNSIYGLKIK